MALLLPLLLVDASVDASSSSDAQRVLLSKRRRTTHQEPGDPNFCAKKKSDGTWHHPPCRHGHGQCKIDKDCEPADHQMCRTLLD